MLQVATHNIHFGYVWRNGLKLELGVETRAGADYVAYMLILSSFHALILRQIDVFALMAICDAFDVSLLLLVSDLDHDFDAYHPSWGPSNTSN
ncbi:hypothetical protein Tco_0981347 [Tanacetum coccineum]